MCFSMSMSFLAAGVLTSIGVLTLKKVSRSNELPFACIPFIFAIQQAAEGILWLLLPTGHHPGIITFATYVFLTSALIMWPLYIPVSILLTEPYPRARGIMAFCFLIGLGWSLDILWIGIHHGASASIHQCHLLYKFFTRETHYLMYIAVYCFSTLLPFFASHNSLIRFMGGLIAASCMLTYFVWSSFFISVWCFFAALLSLAVYTIVPIKTR